MMVYLTEEGNLDTGANTQGRRPCKDRDRDCEDISIRRGTPSTDGIQQKLGEARKDSFLEP